VFFGVFEGFVIRKWVFFGVFEGFFGVLVFFLWENGYFLGVFHIKMVVCIVIFHEYITFYHKGNETPILRTTKKSCFLYKNDS
jgi:hypothetical protein